MFLRLVHKEEKTMEVILLERSQNLGNVGDFVKVKNGYARNFLLPFKKALRATDENRKVFEAQRATLEKENNERKVKAEKLAVKLEGQFVVLIRQAGEDGRLFGSVSAKDISDAAADASSVEVKRNQVVQFNPIKQLGVHNVKISLHPEVIVNVHVNVARSAGEAEIAKKEFLTPVKKESDENLTSSAAVDGEATSTEEGAEAAKTKKKKKKSAKIVNIELKDEATDQESKTA